MKTLRNTEAVMQTYLQKYLRKYLKVTVKAYMQKGLACGTAVEFYNIVYITDNDTNRVIVISPLINKAEFMSVAFKKPFPYTIRVTDEPQTVKDAANIVNNFESYLSTLTQNIRSKVDKKLPKRS